MKRGDIYYADLEPTVGDEIKKKRPVLVVSNNANNRAANTVTIIPITSNIKKIYPFEVLLTAGETNLSKDSKAQCHQIRTISKLRIQNNKVEGSANSDILHRISLALKLHLGIEK